MNVEIREIGPDEVEQVSELWHRCGESDADLMTPRAIQLHVRRHTGLSLCAREEDGLIVGAALVSPVKGGYRLRIVADNDRVDDEVRHQLLDKATMKLATTGVQRCQVTLGHDEEHANLMPQLRWSITQDFGAPTHAASTNEQPLVQAPPETHPEASPAAPMSAMV